MSAALRATIAEARLRDDATRFRLHLAAECVRTALKFNPNWQAQPCVPAGNPDGGQWTDQTVGRRGDHWHDEAVESLILAADITGLTKHGINQAINRKVTPGAILDAIRNPPSVQIRPNGTTRYAGKEAVVVLNPAGAIVTVWGQ